MSELFFLAMSKVKIFKCNETVEILKASRAGISLKISILKDSSRAGEIFSYRDGTMCIFTSLPKSMSFLTERQKTKFVANLRGDRAISLVSLLDFQFCFFIVLNNLKSRVEVVWDDTSFLIQVTHHKFFRFSCFVVL